MKKQYIQPKSIISVIAIEKMVCTSVDTGIMTTSTNASSSNEVMVKDQGSYDVWDDDWSE